MPVIDVTDLKAHLAITFSTDDVLLGDKILVAQECVEKFIGAELDDTEAFPDGCPEPLKEAVRQFAAHLYANREPVIVGVSSQLQPLGVFDLLAPYRAWCF